MNNRFQRPWRKLRDRRGMMMAELLIVVAIVAVLSGVAFIGVTQYQRSLGQLERDEIAKQIFVAAQNHLTATKGTTYQTDDLGTEEGDGKYYLVYNRGDTVDAGSILRDMLPLGSIDETIRAGGNYIIRYHRQSNTVLDVFYCSSAGSPQKFNHSFFADGDSYPNVVLMADPAMKSERKTYVNNSILGWYGGASAETVSYEEDLEDPEIIIHNDEILWVEIKDNNADNAKASLQLSVKGASGEAVFTLRSEGTGKDGSRINWIGNTCHVLLDDITTNGLHFSELASGDNLTVSGTFTPGENLTIEATAYYQNALGNIASSGKQVTNSLFDSVRGDTAYVSRFRHFENLEESISDVSGTTVKNAEQVHDLVWNKETSPVSNDATDFKHRVRYIKETFFGKSTAPVTVYVGADPQPEDCLYPVSPGYDLAYNGGNHSVSNVKVDQSGDAGLFGTLQSHTFSIQNLELIDFNVTGTNAGALAGTANAAITNVLARSSGSATATNISASGSAGGLIGSMTGGSVTDSAAALIVGEKTVNGTVIRPTTAGGLIGTTSGAATVNRCYSGGHTVNGAYDANHYNVTATGAAGGLIGDAGDAAITNSYSTCSATGATAGGFVGTASGASVDNCYCTGLVKGTAAEGAFAASEIGNASGCQYFSIINERSDAAGSFTYLKACGGADNDAVTPFDETAASYNSFVPSSDLAPARPYDAALLKYYSGKYSLPSIKDLSNAAQTGYVSAHYGDWPAPEIFTINN